jgi:hypothetical protein
MSVASLTSLAAVRNLGAPTRSDVGKSPPSAPDASSVAKLRDLLVTQVPTEIIAPYTAVTAVVVGAIAQPTPENPDPNDYIALRVGLLIFAVALVIAIVGTRGYGKQTTPQKRIPWLEITGGAVAATAWAFLLPESPLAAAIDDNVIRAILPAVVGFVGVGINLVIAELLKAPASPPPPPPPPPAP